MLCFIPHFLGLLFGRSYSVSFLFLYSFYLYVLLFLFIVGIVFFYICFSFLSALYSILVYIKCHPSDISFKTQYSKGFHCIFFVVLCPFLFAPLSKAPPPTHLTNRPPDDRPPPPTAHHHRPTDRPPDRPTDRPTDHAPTSGPTDRPTTPRPTTPRRWVGLDISKRIGSSYFVARFARNRPEFALFLP